MHFILYLEIAPVLPDFNVNALHLQAMIELVLYLYIRIRLIPLIDSFPIWFGAQLKERLGFDLIEAR